MSNTKPIPIPPKLVWREFVARYLPFIVFAIVLVSALIFWRQRLSPASILGEAETLQAVVNAPDTGILAQLNVRGFQQVKRGDVIGKIVATDPKSPVLLVAPIEGAVTYLHAAVGDKLKAGFPVVTIAGNQPDRIVAFLRQPIAFIPEEGAPVEVHPRARHRGTIIATIQRVGLQLAPIRPSLLPLAAARHETTYSEYGLPVIINVPPELNLYPGEVVDLTILPKPALKPAPQLPPPSVPKTNTPSVVVTNTSPPAATNKPPTTAPVKK